MAKDFILRLPDAPPLRVASQADLDVLTERWQQLLDTQSIAHNSRIAYQKDIYYFWAWFWFYYPDQRDRIGLYPLTVNQVLEFIRFHSLPLEDADTLAQLADEDRRRLAEDEAFRQEIDKILCNLVKSRRGGRVYHFKAKPGPFKPATLKRMVATLSRMHEKFGDDNPCRHSRVRKALARIKQQLAGAAKREHQKKDEPVDQAIIDLHTVTRKEPITRDILYRMLQTCDDTLIGIRDRAILTVMFNSGGRRRSEISNLQFQQVTRLADGFKLDFGATKTRKDGQPNFKPIQGDAAKYLDDWIRAAQITEGRLFRGFKPHAFRLKKTDVKDSSPVDMSTVLTDSLSPHAIADMIKKRIELIGEDPALFSGHSIRAGYATQASMDGVHMLEAMALSEHEDVNQFKEYYRPGELWNSRAANLLAYPAPEIGKRKGLQIESMHVDAKTKRVYVTAVDENHVERDIVMSFEHVTLDALMAEAATNLMANHFGAIITHVDAGKGEINAQGLFSQESIGQEEISC